MLGVAVDALGVGQLLLREARGDVAGVLGQDFDAQEVALGIAGGGRAEEQALAAADFDLERGLAAKLRGAIPGLRQLFEPGEIRRQIERRIDAA